MNMREWPRMLWIAAFVMAPAGAVAGEPVATVPVLRAHSSVLDVREGDLWMPGEWRADPGRALDEYRLRVARGPVRFALVSDLDSLVFTVAAGESHEFYVVLETGDSCRTRVTGLDTGLHSSRPVDAMADTLRFELGRDGRPYFTGIVGDSKPLRLMFDAGGGDAMLAPRAFKKGVKFVGHDTVLNVGGGGAVSRAIGHAGGLRVGTTTWPQMEFIKTDKDFTDADGLVGWRLFDQRVVKFDFVDRVAIVLDSLPVTPDGYRTLPLRWVGSLPMIEVEVGTGTASGMELLQLDTGSNSALRLTAGAAHWPRYDQDLEKLGEGESRGTGPKVRKTRYVRIPLLRVAGFELPDVMSDLEEPMPGEAPGLSHLGMGVLGRFDLIIDFRAQRVHVRPNSRFSEPVTRAGASRREPFTVALVTAFALALGVSAWFGLRRARAR